jgi:hypothetical protein
LNPSERDGSLQEVTVETEVRAAHNVLEACAQTETMERVVFTSSVTAVFWSADHKQQQQLVDEKCWSDLAFCKKFKVFPLIVSVRASTSFSTRVKERMNEPPGSLVVATRFQVKQARHAIYLFIYLYIALPCPIKCCVRE